MTAKTNSTATVTNLYANVYRLRLGKGQSFQIERGRKSVDLYKFSAKARKFKFVGELPSMNEAEAAIRSGKYRKLFA